MMSDGPQHFLQFFQRGGSPQQQLNVCGRIFRHDSNGPTFLSLSVDLDDPKQPDRKPFVFATGPDGCHKLLVEYGACMVHEFLVHLGCEASWIDHVLEKDKRRFAIILLPTTNSGEQREGEAQETPIGVRATWDGLLQCVATVPGLLEYAEKYGEECKQTNMADFVKCKEFLSKYRSVKHVDAADIDQDPSIFLTPRRFLDRTAHTFVDFRVLLWTWFGASHLFAGDGYTKNEWGEKGSSEFLIPNLPVKELQEKGAALLPLKVLLSNGQDPDSFFGRLHAFAEKCCGGCLLGCLGLLRPATRSARTDAS